MSIHNVLAALRGARGLLPLSVAMACLLAFADGADAKNKHCPPGLAKKSPACVPPGQAAKHGGLWRTGDRLPEDDVHWITYPDRYSLPPLPAGQRYAVLGNQLYVVDEGTSRILNVLTAISAILD